MELAASWEVPRPASEWSRQCKYPGLAPWQEAKCGCNLMVIRHVQRVVIERVGRSFEHTVGSYHGCGDAGRVVLSLFLHFPFSQARENGVV